MLALFWAPRYFYFRTKLHELREWTIPSLRSQLDAHALFLVLLADNTELISESSLNALLQLYLFSFKLDPAHSLKLFTACLSSGVIVYRPPLFGGSTPEVTPLEWFLRCRELADLRQLHHLTRVICAVDMGFTATDPKVLSQSGVELLFPSRHVGNQRLSIAEVLIKEVRYLWHQELKQCRRSSSYGTRWNSTMEFRRHGARLHTRA